LRKPEASKVWELMVADVVRSIHFIPGPGALLHLEAKDDAEAQAYINHLPMVRAGVVSVELLPLRPFTGLEALFANLSDRVPSRTRGIDSCISNLLEERLD
jgi:hypothetical protein